MTSKKPKIQIIPLGGLGEIGKNMTVIEYGNDMVLVDAGLAFPDDDMYGIDFVLPDFSYVLENRDKLVAILLTHGHEDHIGALPYLLKQVSVPVYGTRLTMGLVQGKIAEHGFTLHSHSRVVKTGEVIQLGSLSAEYVRISHSIPDAASIAIRTPLGTIFHTGDFKLDQTPVDGNPPDFARLAEIGDEGVLALLSDSTNAERPGFTGSETTVGRNLDAVIAAAKQRVLVASFASNVHRVQQVLNAAYKNGRKLAVVGRSMENVVAISQDLGYLQVPEGSIIDIDDLHRYPANQVVVMTTGSQGEPMSALTRMSTSEHKKVEIVAGDTVVFAATPIPGNEKAVSRTVNNLYRRGADVIYSSNYGVHVSGHAAQEELKLMLNLIRPKYFIPVHGEYRHLVHHAQLAHSLRIPRENTFILDNGSVLEITNNGISAAGRVTAGKVLVDGLGVGDVGNIVLRDRKQLAQDGVIIVVVGIDRDSNEVVAGPDLVSRGFVYVREADGLMDEAKVKIRETLLKCEEKKLTDWAVIKQSVRDVLGRYLFERTRRRPMILPIIMEV